MDRRNFIKLFGATAATASASKILANIPEAEPKIQVLEEKSIINISNEIVTFAENVIELEYSNKDNGQFLYLDNEKSKGKWISGFKKGQVITSVYLNNNFKYKIDNLPNFYFTFNIPTIQNQNYYIINNRRFMCIDIKVEVHYDSIMVASIMGVEIA